MQPIKPTKPPLANAFAAVICAAALSLSTTAFAALGSVKSGIEATGRVDLDGLGPGAPQSALTDNEITLPFPRSIVSVADADPGVYSYFASADVGNLALKVAGSITNDTGAAFSDNEVGLLRASAEVRDLITLTTTRTDSFDVTMELIVNGTITAGAGSSARANSQLQFGPDPGLNTFDSNLYGPGVISDTLSITRTVSGPEIHMDFAALLFFSITEVAPGDTVSGQLNNTAFIRLIVPEDVIVASSESGTFGVPIPVPEPQTYAMFVAGLVLLFFATSGQRRRASA